MQSENLNPNAEPGLPPRYSPQPLTDPTNVQYQPPSPSMMPSGFNDASDDPAHPVHYSRDPTRLVGYLVPLPKPHLKHISPDAIPTRFLIYTPPPPPLQPPKEGEKEAKFHKLQRKWQEEVRSAKTSTAKTASWHGIKSKATRGMNIAMGYTKTSSLDFVNRVQTEQHIQNEPTQKDHLDDDEKHAADPQHQEPDTHKTVALEAMTLVYPPAIAQDPMQLREEFVNTMMRTRSKAQRDAVVATGLLPVSLAIDLFATFIWPFGGLFEIDSVWLYSSARGAKISRNVTKRLTSSSHSGDHDKDQLRLEFVPSRRLEVLERYLACTCHDKDASMFPYTGHRPTETEVLEAIGWSPSQNGGQDSSKNWEDEMWETDEVKDDVKGIMSKAAREWTKWIKLYEKNPEKASRK